MRTQRPIGSFGSAVRVLLTFHLLLVTWVFFRAQSIPDALTVLGRIGSSLGAARATASNCGRAREVLAALLLIALLMTVEWLDESRARCGRVRLAAKPTAVRWAAYYALAVAVLVFGVWNVQQFVYMQF